MSIQTTPEGSPRRVVIRRAPVEEPRPSGRGGCFWLTIGMTSIVLILVVALVVLIALGITTIGNITTSIENMFRPGPPVAQISTTQSVVTSIQSMGQLVSVSMEMAKADINVHVQQGLLNANSFTTSHVAEGEIQAGIDLTQMTEDNVHYDVLTGIYTITLPHAQLTSCNVRYIRQYDYSGTILPVDRDEARLLAEYMALVEFRDDSIERGILTRAEQQATQVFGNVIRMLTGHDVQIVYQEAATALPRSCEPDIPGNWNYDPATQTWTRP